MWLYHSDSLLSFLFFLIEVKLDLQCCVSFWCTAEWLSYTSIYALFFIFFSITVYHRILTIAPRALQWDLGVYLI